MYTSIKFALAVLAGVCMLCLGIALGSSPINFVDTLGVIGHKVFGFALPGRVGDAELTIVWTLRLPRALLAFLSGGAFAASGAVFQSVLKNELASPYIVGVSAGASLGAALVILTGAALPLVGAFTLPAAGFAAGLITVLFVTVCSMRLDQTFSNNTIILFGMVFSLFINAVLVMLSALYREELKSLLYWQMGSFSLKGWFYVVLLLPFLATGVAGIFRYTREMDILAFGDDQAKSLGVDANAVRITLLVFSAVLTGAAVALSGAIGFIDLISPHAARRLVGSRHCLVIPMSFLIGASLLVAADIAARTIVSPSELPVGALTAFIGGPFFIWVYFRKKGKSRAGRQHAGS